MPLSQEHVSEKTPMGATVLPGGGATFRVWAPNASSVHLVTASFDAFTPTGASALVKRPDGTWAGFHANVKPGDAYMFHVRSSEGEGGNQRRDPYARELTTIPYWPDSRCVLRDATAYPWHDESFQAPKPDEMFIYQMHVGCFSGPDREHRVARFLDVIDRVDHLASSGVNVVQLLPIAEFNTATSMGYNGVDLYSPELDYGVDNDTELLDYLKQINTRLGKMGLSPLTLADARGAYNQLKILVDLLHLHKIAVVLDVVYNHAGSGDDRGSMLTLDRQPDGSSLYFSDENHCGPVFDFRKPEVRRFLIDNAAFYLLEMHFDGLRFDQVSVIDGQGKGQGWKFCQDMTKEILAKKPGALLNAEYWTWDGGPNTWIVKPTQEGGAGFNATQHNALRCAVRAAVRQSSGGMSAELSMDAIASSLKGNGFAPDQMVNCVSNHDIVYAGPGIDRSERVPKLADPTNGWSVWAKGRTRVASALLMTSSGIPMVFMGEEMLETKRWHDSRNPEFLLWWDGVDRGVKCVTDMRSFVSDLAALRRTRAVLRAGDVDPYHVHNVNRVLAYRRTRTNEKDIVVVASFNDNTFRDYELGFPEAGDWNEIFNTDFYEDLPNPNVQGNYGRARADGPGRHRMPSSARLTLPARSLLVFEKA